MKAVALVERQGLVRVLGVDVELGGGHTSVSQRRKRPAQQRGGQDRDGATADA